MSQEANFVKVNLQFYRLVMKKRKLKLKRAYIIEM